MVDQKKEKYREQATAALAEYKAAMDDFRQQHPGLTVQKRPPRRPALRPVDIFLKKNSSLLRAEALAAYKALSGEEKEHYRLKADRAEERFWREVEAYQGLHPGWKPPSIWTKKVKKGPAKPRRDPAVWRRWRRAYDVFLREAFQSPEVKEKPNEERMRLCIERWRSMETKDRLPYKERAGEENQAYILSLPEER